MREIISLHIGQGGVNLGNACWELFCLEHNIQPDGTLSPEKTHNNDILETMFSENPSGSYTPRSIFIDSDPDPIDQIRKGPFNKAFHPDNLISGKQDFASNFVKGNNTEGKELFNKCEDQIRKVIESCDNLQGFIFTHAISGGTGSGFSALLYERFGIVYPKKTKVGFTIFPSPKYSDTIVEPYNSVFSLDTFIRDAEMIVAMDNEAVYDICSAHLDNEIPSYSNINRIMALAIASSLSSMRFKGGYLNTNLKELETNLVPFPNLHFTLSSFAPFIPPEKVHNKQPTITQITKAAFDKNYMLAKVDPKVGKYVACSLMYRGLINPWEVTNAVIKMRKKLDFINWVPSGFKTGINTQPPVFIPGDMAKVKNTLCAIMNTSAFGQILNSIEDRFHKLYNKRAFVHWFLGEGIRSELISSADWEFADLKRAYRSLEENDKESDSD